MNSTDHGEPRLEGGAATPRHREAIPPAAASSASRAAKRRPANRPIRARQRAAWYAARDRGAVAMEFALVAPFLVAVVLAMLELGRSFEVQQTLDAAAREGARLGAMDRRGLLESNQTSNQKIELDMRSFLTAAGLPGDLCQISITKESDSTVNFNFDAPGNAYELFRIRLEMPYAAVRIVPAKWLNQEYMESEVVFRSSRPALSD